LEKGSLRKFSKVCNGGRDKTSFIGFDKESVRAIRRGREVKTFILG
jgi:hypothetical protein